MPLSPEAEEKLNEGEREVLLLLAGGHTIKTAATQLGLTENAVNERLRSARRKTGAQSSRELARALYPIDAQISWDELSVVPDGPATPDPDRHRLPLPVGWPTRKGIVIMSAIAILATTAFLAFTQLPGSAPEQDADAVLPPLAAPGLELRQRLESEPSDPDWALATQSELSRRFSQREGVQLAAVRCRTSLCEVNAFVRRDDRREAIRSVSDRAFLESLSDAGVSEVEAIDMRFMDSEERGTITVFLARAE